MGPTLSNNLCLLDQEPLLMKTQAEMNKDLTLSKAST